MTQLAERLAPLPQEADPAPHPERQYLDLMRTILETGDRRVDRTGVGTLSVFGAVLRFDLSDGTVPVLTTKRVYWKLAVKEMLWFLTGGTNIRPLLQQNVHIWSDWPHDRFRRETGEEISQAEFEQRVLDDEAFAAKWGDLGPVYGKQWRRWRGADGRDHDQIAALIDTLRTNPASRRMLFHAWNVPEIPDMALPPCHMVYQFHVDGQDRLNMLIFQRSCDLLLGAPFNLVGGAALLMMIAQQAGLEPGRLTWMGGDVHLYLNHMEQARLQLGRSPRPLPRLRLTRRPESIDDYRIEDFELSGYDPHPAIAAAVAV
jgi:thymidylate synthase